MRLTQQLTIRVLLGESFEDQGGRFAAAATTRRQYIEYFFTLNLSFPEYLPTRIVWRFRKALAHMHVIILSRVVQHFGFHPIRRHAVEPRPSIVLEPRSGLPMRLIEQRIGALGTHQKQ